MTRTRNMADLLDSNGDVKSTALDNTSSDLVDDTTPQLGGSLLANGNTIDMEGNELILDADGDTSITADTDDQIDFKTGGNDRLSISSNGVNNVLKTQAHHPLKAPDDNGGGSKISAHWGGQEIASLEFDLTDGTNGSEDRVMPNIYANNSGNCKTY